MSLKQIDPGRWDKTYLTKLVLGNAGKRADISKGWPKDGM